MFTLPPGFGGRDGDVPPNAVVQFEVELISWTTVVNLSKDGGIIKKMLEKGKRNIERLGTHYVIVMIFFLVIRFCRYMRLLSSSIPMSKLLF